MEVRKRTGKGEVWGKPMFATWKKHGCLGWTLWDCSRNIITQQWECWWCRDCHKNAWREELQEAQTHFWESWTEQLLKFSLRCTCVCVLFKRKKLRAIFLFYQIKLPLYAQNIYASVLFFFIRALSHCNQFQILTYFYRCNAAVIYKM